ncbi:MAG: cytochrome c/FTR1 family iron permease [Nevskiales bacterium]
MNALHMLDYIGVDYPEFVQDGRVKNEAEYVEQVEFASEVAAVLARLPATPAQTELLRQATGLQQAIHDKVAGREITALTDALSTALVRHYPVPQAPRRAPDMTQVQAQYQNACASCHGASGGGDGAAGTGLEPPPANFLDRARAEQRSVFGLYNVISLGVAGTGMPSFKQFSEAERWALAFYVSQLSNSGDEKARGERLWRDQAAAARALPDLQHLANALPNAQARQHGAAGTDVLAWLRAHPEALQRSEENPLALASAQIKASAQSYGAGQAQLALQQALAAYLDGFELAEAALAAADPQLVRTIEQQMMDYRALIKTGAPAERVMASAAEIQAQLDIARDRLTEAVHAPLGSFVGSFIILAREGLEVILVLAAMFTFLKRAERSDALPWVHAGWSSALLLGIATWFASTYFINISGATRELTEGFTALVAAVILLSVGLWLHNKSYSSRWQQYVAGKMKGALSSGGLWGIALLSFIATYREVFETVLFYRALWDQGSHGAILLGMAAAGLMLAGVIWAVFALSMRLPIRQFFTASSVLIVILAVVFTGQGVAALQEAGWLSAQNVAFIRVPLLGIYPNLQGLSLQAAVLMLVLSGFAWNHVTAGRAVTD